MAVGHHSDVCRNAGNSDLADASRTKDTKIARGSWLQADPETRRKKRVARYKVFTVERKVKESVRSGCRWIKNKYIEVRYGWF
uniref:Uncharacterized protein n=1 Tax=Physcomitrium patens TaxID=3218 RepID=A0A2K1LBH1_PHYPA|nr:hypothetical protein PHYPA_001802 [Physcomitrium patens]